MSECHEKNKRCSEKRFDQSLTGLGFAKRRGSELADEFTRLEVQIATILMAFGGIFLGFFLTSELDLETLLDEWLFLVKFTYASSMFFLVLSLALGLIHIKRKEIFWENDLHRRVILNKEWRSVMEGETPFEIAKSFHRGVGQEKGVIVHSPKWTWILQTVSLSIAIFLFYVLFLAFLIAS